MRGGLEWFPSAIMQKMACGAFPLQHACICTVLQQHALCVCVSSQDTLLLTFVRACVCVCVGERDCVCLFYLLSNTEAVLALLQYGLLKARGGGGSNVIG